MAKTKAALEREELEAKIKKLNKECEALDSQSSKSYRRQEILKSVASFISVVIGVITVVFSVVQFTNTSQQTLNARKEDRLTAALTNLIDTSYRKRLFATVSIRSFIEKGEDVKNSQALIALVNALAIENDPTVQNSILDVFRSSEIQKVDTGVLKNVLYSLVELDRDLVEKYPEVKYFFAKDLLSFSKQQIFTKAENISKAIIYLLKQEIIVNNLTNIYLSGGDFSNLRLSNMDFSGSALAFARFDKAECVNCIFNNTNLLGGSFVSANLRNSKFQGSPEADEGGNFIDNVFFSDVKIFVNFPTILDFNHADLSNTQFNNFPLAGFYVSIKDNVDHSFNTSLGQCYSVNFEKAIIDNTDFSEFQFFMLTPKSNSSHFDDMTPFDIKSYRSKISSEFILKDFYLQPNVALPRDTDGLVNETFLKAIANTFAGTNWKKAKFPKGISDWFKKNSPPVTSESDEW